VVDQNVRDPDGTEIKDITIVKDGDGAEVLAITDDGKVVLVVQRRVPIGVARHIELPQGKVGNRNPFAVGQSELLEETGYQASSWIKIYKWLDRFPARSDQWLHIFLATGLKKVSGVIDREEIIAVREIPLHDAFKLVGTDGGIYEASTVIALQWAMLNLEAITAQGVTFKAPDPL
jgi:ADP-ribose pyrophosphatase